ncbi:hypothetical protein [Streptomyces sp. NPDC018584]|uniref:hypothetical protein n=1 Tax=unclassified Streptomyces TaxID=2593676 RepID=UPI0037938231
MKTNNRPGQPLLPLYWSCPGILLARAAGTTFPLARVTLHPNRPRRPAGAGITGL